MPAADVGIVSVRGAAGPAGARRVFRLYSGPASSLSAFSDGAK
jgi:hypothetical protein